MQKEVKRYCLVGCQEKDVSKLSIGALLQHKKSGTVCVITKSEYHPETKSVNIEMEKINFN